LLASYGIGLTRAVGAIVEVHHDEKGIVWPKEVAPYDVHLVHIEDRRLKNLPRKSTIPWKKTGLSFVGR